MMMRTGSSRLISTIGALALGVVLVVGCDKVPLTAPSSSTVSVSAGSLVLPTGGSTQVTATVVEQAGTPVQNGTTVRFTTNLGRMDPAEVQTKNGLATSTFMAGDVSGEATVNVTSGGIVGSTVPGTTATLLKILVGAAAINTVTVRASAGSVPATGGSVDIVATVLNAGGGVVSGVPVTFSTTAGSLSSSRDVTDGAGEAKTRLTTDATATVTARAGTKDGSIAIQAQNPVTTPTITLAGTGVVPATSVAQLWNFVATVPTTTAYGTPTKFEWNFGDGATAETNGSTTTHAYSHELTIYTVTVKATFGNGLSISASADIVTADFP